MSARYAYPGTDAADWTRRIARAVALWQDGLIDSAVLGAVFLDDAPLYRRIMQDLAAGAPTPAGLGRDVARALAPSPA